MGGARVGVGGVLAVAYATKHAHEAFPALDAAINLNDSSR